MNHEHTTFPATGAGHLRTYRSVLRLALATLMILPTLPNSAANPRVSASTRTVFIYRDPPKAPSYISQVKPMRLRFEDTVIRGPSPEDPVAALKAFQEEQEQAARQQATVEEEAAKPQGVLDEIASSIPSSGARNRDAAPPDEEPLINEVVEVISEQAAHNDPVSPPPPPKLLFKDRFKQAGYNESLPVFEMPVGSGARLYMPLLPSAPVQTPAPPSSATYDQK